jgi:DNA mismatch repair protein MutS2
MYPKSIEEKLGFDKVKLHLKSLCVSEGGRTHVEQMKWLRSKDALEQRLSAVFELQEILQTSPLLYPQIADIKDLIAELNLKGAFLAAEEIHQFKYLIQEILDLQNFIRPKEKAKQLNKLFSFQSFNDLEALSLSIHKIIDDEGELKPDASPAYLKLSQAIGRINKDVLKRVTQLHDNSADKGWAAETGISIREGRYVLPVIAEHKKKIKGIVHDESKGGKVYYIEPLEILELTNQLKETELERKREEIKILKAITKELAIEVKALKLGLRHLFLYDFIKAKTLYASENDATKPHFSENKSYFNLEQARHPLLDLKIKEEGGTIVPLNLGLHENQEMIIISGPNAGGKSVTLKTVALNQYMWQCGMLVCCKPESEMALYDSLFIDIGDNQSIDNNLSSYSSHLKAMKHFINNADENTLFIIDELGSGTDPQFGGPIGEAVLDMLYDKGAKGLISTHFSNIKNYAQKKEGVANAAMAYDPVHLEPLYELQVGKPGSSFAFEVAKKIGLNKKVLQLAKKRTNLKQQKVDTLLASLEKENKELKEERKNIIRKSELAETLQVEYKELKAELNAQKKDILAQAKTKALDIIKGANKEIENTIKSIKEEKAQKSETRKIRQKLEHKAKKLEKGILESSTKKVFAKPLEVGDRVKLPGMDNYGEIIEIRKRKATVMAGLIKTSIPLDQLVKEGKTVVPEKKSVPSASLDLVKKQANFNSEIDLRGERTEEALRRLDQWIDTALVTGFTRLRVIHGKGHGILKDRIRNHLKGQPFVVSIEYESIQLGGEGVSIISLK